MKMPQLLVILLTILLHAATAFPSVRRQQEKSASWDDVNVVAHGLLQLGQGLKEHVDKSKAQMRDVNSKLKAFNATLAELEKKQKEQSEGLMARSKEVEEREKLAAEQSEEVRVKVEEMKKQGEDINSRMDRLEEAVQETLKEPKLESNNSEHTGASFIQVRRETLFNFFNHILYLTNTTLKILQKVKASFLDSNVYPLVHFRDFWPLRTDASISWWRKSSSNKTNWRNKVFTCKLCRAR